MSIMFVSDLNMALCGLSSYLLALTYFFVLATKGNINMLFRTEHSCTVVLSTWSSHESLHLSLFTVKRTFSD